MRSTDVSIEGVGMLHVEDNCQVFSENFLLLSATSGYTNITLTPGQVVIPELPDLLMEEETQVLEGHQDETDGTLRTLDSLMTQSFSAERQHEFNLRDLLSDIQRDQYETHHRGWLITAIALTIIIPICYLTSKCWRQPLLEFASRYARRRTRVPARVPDPKPRVAHTCALSIVDKDCAIEMKPIMGDVEGSTANKMAGAAMTTGDHVPPPPVEPTGCVGVDPSATSPRPLGVRYSQPGRYQP
jgi:hypothetical protein